MKRLSLRILCTQRSRYAFRALLYLAKNWERGLILTSEISAQQRIPRKFLAGILNGLRHGGLLRSRQGKVGGYQFARSPASVTLWEVINTIDEPLDTIPCIGDSVQTPCAGCVAVDTCMLRLTMHDVYAAITGVLDKTTFQDFLDRGDALDAEKMLTFEI